MSNCRDRRHLVLVERRHAPCVMPSYGMEWKPEYFTAIAVYSDMEETLSFDCPHALINKFVENTRWSAKNNHADVPTDCPTRERHGWTGDAQIFCDTASYFFDYAVFARKYLKDMRGGYGKLIETEKYSYDTDRQAKLVRPLYLNLLNEKQTEFAKARLLKALDSYGWRLGTGFLSTPFILYVLADMDIEYAYRLLENEQMPGWLFMPKMGANTIWESWEGTQAQGGVASLNHYSKGAVCEWLFGEMCGIQIAENNTYIVAPKAGGSITYASCEYNDVYGKVKSEWQRENGKTIYRITVLANVSVEAILLDGEHVCGAGIHEISMPE